MPKYKDLTGQKFGKLTVLEKDNTKTGGAAYWICRCDCGQIKVARGSNLLNGSTSHCGCSRKSNTVLDMDSLIGKRFNRLIVIERDMSKPIGHGHSSYWKCQCDCGNVVSVSHSGLTTGKIQSCGCLKSEKTTERQTLDLTNQRFGKLVALKNTNQLSSHHSYIWECKCDCGNIHYVSAENLRSGKTNSCGCQKKSRGEEIITQILLKHNISFIAEFGFPDLISEAKVMLRYDFAILNDDNQVIKLIEFDGEQHYDKRSKYYSETIVKHDKLKNNYAKQHNIPLIRIPYDQLNNLNFDILFNQDDKFQIK